MTTMQTRQELALREGGWVLINHSPIGDKEKPMKILATIGMLALVSIWAALAVNIPAVATGTAGIFFLIWVAHVWKE